MYTILNRTAGIGHSQNRRGKEGNKKVEEQDRTLRSRDAHGFHIMSEEATKQDLAYKLRYVRRLRGLSTEQLAQRAHVGAGTISNIETREIASPSARTLGRLADALGVPVEYFYRDDAALPREFLGLSPEMAEFVMCPEAAPYLEAAYGAWKQKLPIDLFKAIAKSLKKSEPAKG